MELDGMHQLLMCLAAARSAERGPASLAALLLHMHMHCTATKHTKPAAYSLAELHLTPADAPRRVSISLHGEGGQTNFPLSDYTKEVKQLQVKLAGLTREELQRALGVKPMDKSSQYRGVSKKKGKWEAKVMLNRKWAYRGEWRGRAE
jgi:hypothetical protein